ncbi:MAG: phosphoribosylamine--glycine ligase [Bacteroidia bacterium]|nr:phosphoribosylamine--glycine ligase [Bacteroidia bacterium]
MRVLLLGSGGREHAMALAIHKSPSCTALFTCPGNPGTATLGTNITIQLTDFEKIAEFIQQEHIDLVIVGPEQPLAAGIADYLRPYCFVCGPNQAAAMLESSKSFAKHFFAKNNIPTAQYQVFTTGEYDNVLDYAHKLGFPCVLKADGLAAGKGVAICQNEPELKSTLQDFWADKTLQDAASKVVVEQYLAGKEISCFILTDGKEFIWLPEAKDYKRAQNNDLGPNTGGMGAVSPVPWFNETLKQQIIAQIIYPTLKGLQQEQIDYCGFLFLGIMVLDNQPYILEYNVRLGDPETQVVLPRIKADFAYLCYLAAAKKIQPNTHIEVSPETMLNVVCTSAGYPGKITTGHKIEITHTDALLFHAGTTLDENKQLITAGGRVINVTVAAESLKKAISHAYQAVQSVNFTGKTYRTDIGLDLLPDVH